MMQKILISLAILLTTASCAYQIPIQQGNIVTLEKLDKLRIGMDERQVVYLMGTPMLRDPFHGNRWDYYYSLRTSEGHITRYGASLHFENGKLSRIEKRGEIPAEEPPITANLDS